MATIQRPTITEGQVSTLFWINVLLGALLALASAAIAPGLVAFYREPRLFWVTVALGTGFLLNGAGVQHSALLQRHMRFSALALIETLSLLLSTLVGIAMAAGGLSYWSLVGMTLAQPLFNTVGYWSASRWIPSAPERGAGIASMMRFGGIVTMNSIVVYVGYNLEKVLLGRFGGAEVLGIYGRAYQLVNIPIESFNGAIGGVAFSALSRIQGDPERLRSYFLKGYSLVLALTIPVTIACGFLAGDIVAVALGPKWDRAVPLLQLLAPTILVFSIINPLSWLMLSSNRAGRSLRIAFVIAPVVILAYWLGLPYGARGVAFAFSAAMIGLVVPVCIWSVRDTGVAPADLLRAASRPLISGLVAIAACALAGLFVARWPSALGRLAFTGSLLAAVYAWMLLYVMGQRQFYVELLRSLRRAPVAAEPART
jgi:PST family polysaccharide transporter